MFFHKDSVHFSTIWTLNENHWWCFPFWGSYTPGLRGLSTLYSATCREVAVSVATQKQWPLSTRFGWFFDVLVIITFTVTFTVRWYHRCWVFVSSAVDCWVEESDVMFSLGLWAELLGSTYVEGGHKVWKLFAPIWRASGSTWCFFMSILGR